MPQYFTKKVEESVGMRLSHDITEIRPNEFKGPSFRKGHIIKESDIPHLKRLGKDHIFILDLKDNDVHEDDAVLEYAPFMKGDGMIYDPNPKEGKIQFQALYDGLFKVNVDGLMRFNMISDVMCASIHTNTPVKKNQKLAGTRTIPLVIDRQILNNAKAILQSCFPLFSIKPFVAHKVALVITGNEVKNKLIEDKFETIIKQKFDSYGSHIAQTDFVGDNPELISDTIRNLIRSDYNMIVVTGGMSVDPDDLTRAGIINSQVDSYSYGASVLPGSMFLLAYKESVPIIGIPACAIYHKTTVLDIILPRLLALEKPDKTDLAALGHGGLCADCPTCKFPVCPFGKNG